MIGHVEGNDMLPGGIFISVKSAEAYTARARPLLFHLNVSTYQDAGRKHSLGFSMKLENGGWLQLRTAHARQRLTFLGVWFL